MRHIFIAFTLACFLTAPLSVLAETFSPPSVLLSEIAWSGSTRSDADEWIELANLSDVAVDLTGWRIEGAAGSVPLLIPTGAIPPRGTFIVSNYDEGNAKSVLAVPANYVTSSVSLPNSGLHLLLRDATGVILDEVAGNSFGSSGTVRASMERNGIGADTWVTATTTSGLLATGNDFGTPGTSRIAISAVVAPIIIELTPPETPAPIPDPAPLPDPVIVPILVATPALIDTLTLIHPPVDPPGYAEHDIIITEYSPRDEWVEYRNETNDPIVLEGFTLEDRGSHRIALQGVLTAHSYATTRTPLGTLGNDGDVLRLRDRTGRVLDEFEYSTGSLHAPAPGQGQVAARVKVSAISENDFELTTTATPGFINVITHPKIVKHSTVLADTAPADSAPTIEHVAVALASPKIVKRKIILSGPSTLYAEQSGLFVATLSGTGSGDGIPEWFLDDASVGSGPTLQLVAAIGKHELRVSADVGDNIVEATKSFTVRALKSATSSGALTQLESDSVPARPKRVTTSRSGVGVSVGLTGTVIATERIAGVRKFLVDDGAVVILHYRHPRCHRQRPGTLGQTAVLAVAFDLVTSPGFFRRPGQRGRVSMHPPRTIRNHRPEHAIIQSPLDFINDCRVAGQAEHLAAEFNPGGGDAGFTKRSYI
ncbi:MAG: lamin tail domain-containing protein [Verrucomicrobiota bacterium]